MTRVLIVDAKLEDRMRIRAALQHEGLTVCGDANDAATALSQMERKPDVMVIGLDEKHPYDAGLVGKILEQHAVPIVVCGRGPGFERGGRIFTEATSMGAVCVLPFPAEANAEADQAFAGKVKVMSGVCVVRRKPAKTSLPAPPTRRLLANKTQRFRIVVIGASTGGPEALRILLKVLPKDFPLPIVVAQHISDGFLDQMTQWLSNELALPCHLASDGAALLPGHIYFAADGAHWGVRNDRLLRIDAPPDGGLRPSVARLFRSAAESYGAEAIAVLLTGMGADGAAELKLLRDKGAITFAQDKESAVVFGMPGEAVRLGAAMAILPPLEIGRELDKIARTTGGDA
jgi:two-component system chemotaxis response regulator CheB